MPTGMVIDVLRSLASDPDREPDGELVTRFAAARDAAAFAELVRRHGPTVFGVCRRILGHTQDAEDAFQAVWLVLARRAADVRPPGAVGPWLYGVAVRTATKARSLAMKRRHRQLAAAKPEAVEDAPAAADLGPVLDEELARLPERYRRAVVACDLNGRSRSQAARDLGWPEGTVAARVAKGRELLAARLRRRGVTLSSAALAAVLASAARADLPPTLAANAVAAALEFASGAASASVPPVSIALAEGVMRAMSVSRWKLPAVVLMAAGLAAGGGIVMAQPGKSDANPPGQPAANAARPGRPAAQPADPPPEVERNQDLWVWRERPLPADVEPVGPVTSLAFAPDGRTFVTAGDGRIRQWDLGRLRPTTVAGNRTGPVRHGVTVSPDGTTVAVATPDGAQGMAFPVADEVETRWVLPDKAAGGHAIAVSPDGKRVAVTDGRAVRVESLPPGSGAVQLGPLAGAPKPEDGPPAAVAWAPDGKRLVFLPNVKIDPTWPEAGGPQPDPAKATHYYAQVWGAGSGEPMHLLKQGAAQVTAAAWSADSKRIVTADAAGEVVVWDGETFKELKRLKLRGPITALTVRADGKRFAAGVRAEPEKPGDELAVRVEVWTVWEGSNPDNWLSSSTLSGLTAETVRGLALSPDGKVLAAGTETADGKGGGLRVWDRLFVKAAK
ncbi:MAG TPA: sigma-70 family RNA polymerase sigma factor [Fimbriiglobus sp.]|nr:sigma-70 family RNA polymerase sigma factor [Fimbriiglobus sp.]